MLKESITTLSGMGEQTAKRFYRLGIYTIAELMEYFPKKHEDRSKVTPIEAAVLDDANNIVATVIKEPILKKVNNRVMVSFEVSDGTEQMTIIFFEQPYMKNNFHVGLIYNFYGTVKLKYNKLNMVSPSYQTLEKYTQQTKLIPVYASTYQLSQFIIRKHIKNAIDIAICNVSDVIPTDIVAKHNLMPKRQAIENIHFPKDDASFVEARRRLVFEELFLLQLSLYILKSDFRQKQAGTVKQSPVDLEAFVETLPFKLTAAQQRVVKEVAADLKLLGAANRLIQGDVGSGKTVVAAIALFIVVRNGFQSTLMAPTEVLARQHFEFLEKTFEAFDISVALLTGSTTKKQKMGLLEKLAKGDIDILVGTHALIEDNVVYAKLGLVITDEQHRFGVRQRLSLAQKGDFPDVLAMTATPIPRTLALILYGDMDISTIDELPPGRTPIKTNAVDSRYYARIYKFMREHVSNGRQCYIICPMVEENEKVENVKDVISYAEKLQAEEFAGLAVEYLHGKMKAKDKNKIMERFANGEIDILVSTTVVEVGVNVPNATIILIENAERFGLSQLHQLRGRVGRGSYESFCILVSDSYNKDTRARLKIMQETTDGFKIADTDLQLRGSGEFFGTRQHGLLEMKIANMYTDIDVLKVVQQEVENIMEAGIYGYSDLFNFMQNEYNPMAPVL